MPVVIKVEGEGLVIGRLDRKGGMWDPGLTIPSSLHA